MIEHLRGRDRKLEPLGWTGREAEWIALVCLHSGVFTRSQFCDYFDAQRITAARFVKTLTGRRQAIETDLIAFNGGGSLDLTLFHAVTVRDSAQSHASLVPGSRRV